MPLDDLELSCPAPRDCPLPPPYLLRIDPEHRTREWRPDEVVHAEVGVGIRNGPGGGFCGTAALWTEEGGARSSSIVGASHPDCVPLPEPPAHPTIMLAALLVCGLYLLRRR